MQTQKITIPAAGEKRKQASDKLAKEIDDMDAVVQNFLNTRIKEAIVASDGVSVNVKAPALTSQNKELFLKLCSKYLTPLGYNCQMSHDGGGMYSTLFVSWYESPQNPRA
jgi:hypothetical protein